MKTYFTIGQASQFLNITVEAIRYYEKEGIIPPFERDDNGYRMISPNHLLYLKGVTQLRQAGFSLETIQSMHQDHLTSKQSDSLIHQGLDQVTKQIKALETVKKSLEGHLLSLQKFYKLKDQGYVIQDEDEDFEGRIKSDLDIEDMISDQDLILALTESKPVSSQYLLHAFTYQEESEIESHIEGMHAYCMDHKLKTSHALYLKILAGPSYFVGNALAAILYLNLEDPS